MEKERKIRILSIGALLVAIIGLTVAFAAMSRTLIINGTATVDSAKWDIHFENPLLKSKKGDAREVSAPVISEDGGDLTLKVGLRKPQDEIVYNVDVVNAGDIDAEITKIDYPELTEEHAKIIEFEAVYDDGSSIALAQELNAGESKKVKITIRFKDIEDESLLASEAYNIPLTFKIHYTQSGAGSNSGDGGFTPDGGGDIIDENVLTYPISGTTEDGVTYLLTDDGKIVLGGVEAIYEEYNKDNLSLKIAQAIISDFLGEDDELLIEELESRLRKEFYVPYEAIVAYKEGTLTDEFLIEEIDWYLEDYEFTIDEFIEKISIIKNIIPIDVVEFANEVISFGNEYSGSMDIGGLNPTKVIVTSPTVIKPPLENYGIIIEIK